MSVQTENKDRHNPYKVPDGYFSDLQQQLRARIGEEKTNPLTAWGRVRRMAGVSAAFACLIVLAFSGYYLISYFTPESALEGGTDPLLGYRIYSEDIEELDLYISSDPAADPQFAQAVNDYFDMYGCGYVDPEEIEKLDVK